jgi:hypothetical protein
MARPAHAIGLSVALIATQASAVLRQEELAPGQPVELSLGIVEFPSLGERWLLTATGAVEHRGTPARLFAVPSVCLAGEDPLPLVSVELDASGALVARLADAAVGEAVTLSGSSSVPAPADGAWSRYVLALAFADGVARFAWRCGPRDGLDEAPLQAAADPATSGRWGFGHTGDIAPLPADGPADHILGVWQARSFEASPPEPQAVVQALTDPGYLEDAFDHPLLADGDQRFAIGYATPTFAIGYRPFGVPAEHSGGAASDVAVFIAGDTSYLVRHEVVLRGRTTSIDPFEPSLPIAWTPRPSVTAAEGEPVGAGPAPVTAALRRGELGRTARCVWTSQSWANRQTVSLVTSCGEGFTAADTHPQGYAAAQRQRIAGFILQPCLASGRAAEREMNGGRLGYRTAERCALVEQARSGRVCYSGAANEWNKFFSGMQNPRLVIDEGRSNLIAGGPCFVGAGHDASAPERFALACQSYGLLTHDTPAVVEQFTIAYPGGPPSVRFRWEITDGQQGAPCAVAVHAHGPWNHADLSSPFTTHALVDHEPGSPRDTLVVTGVAGQISTAEVDAGAMAPWDAALARWGAFHVPSQTLLPIHAASHDQSAWTLTTDPLLTATATLGDEILIGRWRMVRLAQHDVASDDPAFSWRRLLVEKPHDPTTGPLVLGNLGCHADAAGGEAVGAIGAGAIAYSLWPDTLVVPAIAQMLHHSGVDIIRVFQTSNESARAWLDAGVRTALPEADVTHWYEPVWPSSGTGGTDRCEDRRAQLRAWAASAGVLHADLADVFGDGVTQWMRGDRSDAIHASAAMYARLSGVIIDAESTLARFSVCDGDLDLDGDTDAFDFAILASHFGRGPGATHAQGDLDGDGFVNTFDFAEFAAGYGCLGD